MEFSWCSGYHIRLTRGRSPVRSRAKTYHFLVDFFFDDNNETFLDPATNNVWALKVDEKVFESVVKLWHAFAKTKKGMRSVSL